MTAPRHLFSISRHERDLRRRLANFLATPPPDPPPPSGQSSAGRVVLLVRTRAIGATPPTRRAAA